MARAGESDPSVDPPPRPKQAEIDLSGDASTIKDRSIYVRLTFSPFGDLDADGLRIALERTGSRYVYNSFTRGADLIVGNDVDEGVLLGYALTRGPVSLTVFMGDDRQSTSTSVPDPRNATVGIKSGLKAAAELSYTINDNLSVESALAYATPNSSSQVDVKGVYRVYGDIGLGPEFIYQSDIFYHQFKLGAALSGWKVGPIEIGLGAGYLHDNLQGPGAYISLDNSLRF